MASTLVIRLDTHAPVVTWGQPSGTVPGSTLVVPYTLDEPSLLSATLTDFDGVQYPMTVEADRLTVNLPDTTALGQATVTALVEDDVGNATDRTLVLAIQASVVPPPPPPPVQIAGGVPRETPPLTERTVRIVRSGAAVASGSRVRVGQVQRSAVAASSRARARSAVAISSAIHVSCMNRANALTEVETAVAVSTAKEITRDESQAALIALLLS